MSKTYDPKEYLRKNYILGQKLNHSIDLIKDYNFDKESIKLNARDLLWPKKKETCIETLLIGSKVKISTTISNNLDIILNYSNGRVKRYNAQDIEGFIFGGFSSRFWLLRTYINMIPTNKLTDNMLCWKMISIQIKGKHKQCHLIIEDET